MPIVVEPKVNLTQVEPAEAAVPAETETETREAPSLSPELLKLPTIQALMAGTPPAASMGIKEFNKRPEGVIISKNKDNLLKAGFGLYRSLSGDLGVLFNQMFISGDAIQQADKAGQLVQVAPPFDQIADVITAMGGKNNPVLTAQTPPAPPLPQFTPPQDVSVTPTTPVVPKAAAGQRQLTAARVKSLIPGGPTTGARPGAGRLLNQILKPVF